MTAVQDIDPFAPGLNANDRAMLMDLIKARDAYCLQGRGREYHAMGKALQIVWHYLEDNAGRPELPATDFGELDVALPIAGGREAARLTDPLTSGFTITQVNAAFDRPR